MRPPKNDPSWLTITPISYCRILFYYKNGGVYKNLELNILKINYSHLKFKENIWILLLLKFWEIFLAEEKIYNFANF